MTARERRMRQFPGVDIPGSLYPQYFRSCGRGNGYGDDERTGPADRRVASYRWLIGHAINTTDKISKAAYLDLIAALRALPAAQPTSEGEERDVECLISAASALLMLTDVNDGNQDAYELLKGELAIWQARSAREGGKR